MASDRRDAWQVAASAPALDYVVAPGRGPRAIRTLTDLTGRQRVPPRWALLPQLDRLVRFPPQTAAKYLSEVRRDLADIRRYRLPLGSYRIEAWEFIPRPTLRRLIHRFHEHGIRVLLYFRAFVGRDEIGTDRPELVDEAIRRGLVATHADGSPYVFQTNFFSDGAMIDFTDPAARRWWARRIDEALDLGADGFMQDFGEQVLLDMHFHDGSTGRTMHNRLPGALPSDDAAGDRELPRAPSGPRRGLLLHARRATPGCPARWPTRTRPGRVTSRPTGRAPAGLAAQAPDMLNRGIAGAYGFGTDIGGYFDVGRPPTTKELFLRWAEWAALTPIFRLHGSVAAGTHTPWTYDAQTVRIYRAPVTAPRRRRAADRAPVAGGGAHRACRSRGRCGWRRRGPRAARPGPGVDARARTCSSRRSSQRARGRAPSTSHAGAGSRRRRASASAAAASRRVAGAARPPALLLPLRHAAVRASLGRCAVHERLVGAAGLAPQPRTRRESGRDAHARHHRQQQPGRHLRRAGDRDRGGAARVGLAERPDRLVAVRRRDRDPDARAGAVGVPLVVERDRDLDVAGRPASATRRPPAGSGRARAACSWRRRACARWRAASRPARRSPCRRA